MTASKLSEGDFMKKTLTSFKLIVFALFSVSNISHAGDQWLCTDESSQIQNGALLACGVGKGKDENEARASAFENAKAEFKRICTASDTCKQHEISVEPKRTSCEGKEGSYKCYRLIVFTIGKETKRAADSSAIENRGNLKNSNSNAKLQHESFRDKSEFFVPFTYESISAFPKVFKGMLKKDLLELFGAPRSVSNNGYSSDGQTILMFFYEGKMCEYASSCYVIVDGDKVERWNSFKPNYTDYLK